MEVEVEVVVLLEAVEMVAVELVELLLVQQGLLTLEVVVVELSTQVVLVVQE